MKTLLYVYSALTAGLSIFLGTGLAPIIGGPSNAGQQTMWRMPAVQYDIITSLDPAAKKLSIEHQGGAIKIARDLTVDAFTEITISGKKADLADLKVGMRVRYVLGGSGTTLASLTTVEAPNPPPTPVPTATPSFPGKH